MGSDEKHSSEKKSQRVNEVVKLAANEDERVTEMGQARPQRTAATLDARPTPKGGQESRPSDPGEQKGQARPPRTPPAEPATTGSDGDSGSSTAAKKDE